MSDELNLYIYLNICMFNSQCFHTLNKPFLNPPDWVFRPVWIILYATILLSVVIYIFCKNMENKTKGYIFFTLQILLNIIWSPVFFGMKNIALALFIIILLDIFVILTIKEFFKSSKTASALLVPYLLWIIFATYLNLSYLLLN
ncbi:MAG TPA: hypothetical protein DEO94_03235 [Cyanobacteria bacterium UBA11991]|nr:TspO/MBR family protein [Cyanobacteriota bacterium]MDY6359243.1 TspO/MBR family protein [Cyanobacteriota bacterium]MDY6364562.1 TspO/MBR family protein [Cyanobacteriota bacterium]MDY6383499.1 TspO/MBR family protein [Cyanobacteriota bacterium]HCB11156.1 hypothetical protein [Cyanobacteria bacterium UBA11991]